MTKNQHQALKIVVTCSGGLEQFLSQEVEKLTGKVPEILVGAVTFSGQPVDIYALCLWSRIASRVLVSIVEFSFSSEGQFYDRLRQVPWHEHFSNDNTLAIAISKAATVNLNTRFFTYRAKDALVDHFQHLFAARPSIDTRKPDVRIHIHCQQDRAEVAFDVVGDPLHQRGYRVAQGEAPMKETLAAAMLMSAGWCQGLEPNTGSVSTPQAPPLIDPMCGSGTLLIEAAMMAAKMAPGLIRKSFGFQHLAWHDESLWRQQVQEAIEQDCSEASSRSIKGFDADAQASSAAQKNIEAAGLSDHIHVERSELANLGARLKGKIEAGVVVCNPPYGERLDENQPVLYLYRGLGWKLQQVVPGWTLALITNQVEFADALQLDDPQTQKVFNGPIRCFLRAGTIVPRGSETARISLQLQSFDREQSPAPDFSNRIVKNTKQLLKWAEREAIDAFRLYDADMPEYNVAVNWYNGRLLVSEYLAPSSIPAEKTALRLQAALDSLALVFGIPVARMYVKSRQRQKGNQQYSKLSNSKHYFLVNEAGARVLVNLEDYLDTGLFLDHRPVRVRLQSLAKNKRVLNLFCYTGVASLQAGLGGAKRTLSVDLSANYLDWARRNFYLNGLSEANHELVRQDCMAWLKASHQQFDLIFVDPPTFSNSKRMRGHFDVQQSHEELLELAMKRLEPGGLLLFSTNFRKFKLAEGLMEKFSVNEITEQTTPPDFSRSKPHRCWEFRWLSAASGSN